MSTGFHCKQTKLQSLKYIHEAIGKDTMLSKSNHALAQDFKLASDSINQEIDQTITTLAANTS